jgi:hypothetical protein
MAVGLTTPTEGTLTVLDGQPGQGLIASDSGQALIICP